MWPGSCRTLQVQWRWGGAQALAPGKLSKDMRDVPRVEVVLATLLYDWEASIWEFLRNHLGILRPKLCVLPLVGTGTLDVGDHCKGTACIFLINSHPSGQPWTTGLRPHKCLMYIPPPRTGIQFRGGKCPSSACPGLLGPHQARGLPGLSSRSGMRRVGSWSIPPSPLTLLFWLHLAQVCPALLFISADRWAPCWESSRTWVLTLLSLSPGPHLRPGTCAWVQEEPTNALSDKTSKLYLQWTRRSEGDYVFLIFGFYSCDIQCGVPLPDLPVYN